MPRLLFKAEEVRRVVYHSLAAPTQGRTWEGVPSQPAVLLVHDHGVYLMSNGEPRDMIPNRVNGDTSFCAYAAGCNPEVDKEWWDYSRSLVGGDDFAEILPAEDVKHHLGAGVSIVAICVTDDSITIITDPVSDKAA